MSKKFSFTTAEAADFLGVSPRTIEKWRLEGRGPKYCKLGRRVTYRLPDLDAYLEATAVGGGR